MIPSLLQQRKRFKAYQKYTYKFSRTKIRETIIKLVEVVELTIAAEMKQMQGCIIYDGWTDPSFTHFFGLFASHMRNFPDHGYARKQASLENTVVLLSCSPMSNYNSDNSDD